MVWHFFWHRLLQLHFGIADGSRTFCKYSQHSVYVCTGISLFRMPTVSTTVPVIYGEGGIAAAVKHHANYSKYYSTGNNLCDIFRSKCIYFCIHSETCESSEKESVERRNLHRHKRLSGSNGKSKIKRIKEFRRILYGCSKTVSVQDFFVLF